MGKQIIYCVDYDTFILLAQKALEYGCKILKEDAKAGVITESDSVDIISKDCFRYYFYVPEAGKYVIKKAGEKEYVDQGYSSSGVTLIEAGMTIVREAKKEMQRGRLFCVSGYYDEKGDFVKRPDCVTKIYNALVRYLKKLVRYTEVEHFVFNPMYAGRKLVSKEYITDKCLMLIENEDYALG